MTQLALPAKKSLPGTFLRPALVVPVVVIVVLVAAVLYFKRPFSGGGDAVRFTTVPTKQGLFEVRVRVTGELQAVDNIDIQCEVEGSSTITQIVPEGTFVKKGDTLVVLDSSAIRQKLEDAQIELQRATADVTTASEMLEIQKSQNAANLEAADVGLQLAKIDLTKYTEGEYPSLLADAKMAMEKALTAQKTKQDDLAQTRALFAKGFVTATEVKTKELDVAAAVRDVTKADTDLKVLEQYSHEADLAAKKNTLAQAEQKLSRTKRENAANLSQKEADLSAKNQQLDVITRRVTRYKEQVEKCNIVAPADGLVVYQNNDRDRASVQEGAQVRERQTLMKLPDTSRMKVVLKANENQVGKLNINQTATVTLPGVSETLTGKLTKISPVSDSTNRWMNPDQKDFPVDVVLDYTPSGLKPGMTAKVDILISQKEDVVSMPLAALYSAGKDRYAFAPEADRATPMKIDIGMTNDQDVEIKGGLTAGQQVVLLEAGQGKLLLERAGIKVDDTPPPAPTGKNGRRRRDGNGPGAAPGGPGAPGGPAAPNNAPATPAADDTAKPAPTNAPAKPAAPEKAANAG